MNNVIVLTQQTAGMMKMFPLGKGNNNKEGAKLLEMETSSDEDQEHFALPASMSNSKNSRKR